MHRYTVQITFDDEEAASPKEAATGVIDWIIANPSLVRVVVTDQETKVVTTIYEEDHANT